MNRTWVTRDESITLETFDPSAAGPVGKQDSSTRAIHVRPLATEEHFSLGQGWRQVLRRLRSRTTWTTALKMQTLVVRNAIGSIVGAWIPSACCALGNIFSGRWYTDQSRNDLMIGNSLWAAVTLCTVVFSFIVAAMLSFRFIIIPQGRPTVWFCYKRLVRATVAYFGAVIGIIFAVNCLVAYLCSISLNLFKYKIECYVNTLTLIGYIAGLSRAVSQIYHEETRQGRDRLEQKHKRRVSVSPEEGVDPRVLVRRLSLKTPIQFQTPTFWRAYARTVPVTLPPFLACIFVHVLSRQRIVDSSNAVLTVFVVASIALKLAVQELAKHYIFKKRVRSARIMCILVGIPTVLIDTQTRIILLGTNNTKTAVMGAVGMAVVEISLRAGKAALLLWEIRRRKVLLERRNANARRNRSTVDTFERRYASKSVVPQVPNSLRSSLSGRLTEFELWRRQVQTFHMAETNADMYAEYISIGCSASILFFYGNHPHYWLLRQSVDVGTVGVDTTAWRVGQLGMLALQVGVEVFVDYASIVLEVVIGIEFDNAKKMGTFLAGVFTIAAAINSAVSICFYLS